MATVEIDITEVMETIVSNIDVSDIPEINSVHYDFGNYIEIANKLSKKNKNNLKYPLFALILDVSETESENNQVYKSYSLNMIIAYNTLKNYSSQERRDNIFKPILQPLYRKLLQGIKQDGYFNISNNFVSHTKYDRYFLGSETPNQNKLNDYIDAIEIEFRDLELYKQENCN